MVVNDFTDDEYDDEVNRDFVIQLPDFVAMFCSVSIPTSTHKLPARLHSRLLHGCAQQHSYVKARDTDTNRLDVELS